MRRMSLSMRYLSDKIFDIVTCLDLRLWNINSLRWFIILAKLWRSVPAIFSRLPRWSSCANTRRLHCMHMQQRYMVLAILIPLSCRFCFLSAVGHNSLWSAWSLAQPRVLSWQTLFSLLEQAQVGLLLTLIAAQSLWLWWFARWLVAHCLTPTWNYLFWLRLAFLCLECLWFVHSLWLNSISRKFLVILVNAESVVVINLIMNYDTSEGKHVYRARIFTRLIPLYTRIVVVTC